MAKTPKIRLIRDKYRAIDEEIKQHRVAIAALEIQAGELKIAERVLASLSIDDEEPEDQGETRRGNGQDTNGDRPKKPPDLPPMPEMIREALSKMGNPGLKPKDIVGYIMKHRWKEVPPESVGPIVWRMLKRHDLIKRGAKYFLRPEEEA